MQSLGVILGKRPQMRAMGRSTFRMMNPNSTCARISPFVQPGLRLCRRISSSDNDSSRARNASCVDSSSVRIDSVALLPSVDVIENGFLIPGACYHKNYRYNCQNALDPGNVRGFVSTLDQYTACGHRIQIFSWRAIAYPVARAACPSENAAF